MATSLTSEPRIELLGAVELLHEHLTKSLCQSGFRRKFSCVVAWA
jgi:hypothetical protein